MFAIINGLPYLIHDGKAIPVSIKANGDFTYDTSKATDTDVKGVYTVTEVLAKCGAVSSIKEAKKTTKQDTVKK